MAGSSVTFAHITEGRFRRIVATCTADASNGSYPATDLPPFSGKLLALRTNPGATAPTDNYDITLVDADGVDRLQGVGGNRSTTNSQEVAIVYSGTTIHPACAWEKLTLTLANNAVNSAVTVITLVYEA